MTLGKCVECGKLARSNELKYLHERLPYFCSKACLLQSLVSPETDPVLPKGAIPVHEGLTSPDFSWSDILHEGFRSQYELHVAEWLHSAEVDYYYETFYFEVGTTTYTPDFYLPRYGQFWEVKGVWANSKKSKMSRFLRQHSDVKLTLVPWTLRDQFYPI
jgi:hypothetical protein